jgi:hypothetical protein
MSHMTTQFLQGANRINIRIDGYHLSRTYAGLLEGKPGHAINQELVEDFTRSLVKVWGPRTTLVIWPEGGPVSTPTSELPAWTCAAWASSDFSLSEDDHGSELVVVWFEASIANVSIEKCATQVLLSLDWQKHATGFWY